VKYFVIMHKLFVQGTIVARQFQQALQILLPLRRDYHPALLRAVFA